jgi:hypothetical protein
VHPGEREKDHKGPSFSVLIDASVLFLLQLPPPLLLLQLLQLLLLQPEKCN